MTATVERRGLVQVLTVELDEDRLPAGAEVAWEMPSEYLAPPSARNRLLSIDGAVVGRFRVCPGGAIGPWSSCWLWSRGGRLALYGSPGELAAQMGGQPMRGDYSVDLQEIAWGGVELRRGAFQLKAGPPRRRKGKSMLGTNAKGGKTLFKLGGSRDKLEALLALLHSSTSAS